jgi:hypothetical protein
MYHLSSFYSVIFNLLRTLHLIAKISPDMCLPTKPLRLSPSFRCAYTYCGLSQSHCASLSAAQFRVRCLNSMTDAARARSNCGYSCLYEKAILFHFLLWPFFRGRFNHLHLTHTRGSPRGSQMRNPPVSLPEVPGWRCSGSAMQKPPLSPGCCLAARQKVSCQEPLRDPATSGHLRLCQQSTRFRFLQMSIPVRNRGADLIVDSRFSASEVS